MARFDANWLLGPIWSVIGPAAIAGAQGCGGKVDTLGGALPVPGPAAPADEQDGAGSRPGSNGAAASGDLEPDGAGGSGGSESTPAVAVWEWQTGARPSGAPLPESTTCRGIAGAQSSNPDETQFGLSTEDINAFCGKAVSAGHVQHGACLPAPPPGQTCAEAYPLADIAGVWSCGYDDLASFVCGLSAPEPGSASCNGDECCYVIGGACAVGRPFMVQGAARQAELESRSDWLAGATDPSAPSLAAVDEQTCRALADVYARDALTEHASIASFARFVIECLALGAPAAIVSDAARALADEVAHAEQSFALASAYAGEALGPSRLDVSGAFGEPLSLHESVRRTLREGCVAETVSAALIHAAAEAAQDAGVKAVLGRVAEDERRHAVLAWRFVSWAVQREGEPLLALVRAELQRAREHVGFGALTALPGDALVMRGHGYLQQHERRAIAMRTIDEVVLPSARALEAAAEEASRRTARDALAGSIPADLVS